MANEDDLDIIGDSREREDLLRAGLELIAEAGVDGATPQAVEERAGATEGALRRHFCDLESYLEALAEYMLRVEEPRIAETPTMMLERWLNQNRPAMRARYEMMVAGLHDPRIRKIIARGRGAYEEGIVAGGLDPDRARLIVAAFDGVLLDALLRDDDGADMTPLFGLFHTAGAARNGIASPGH